MKKERLTESFIVGVIALVFLLVGYQIALFVHHAAVTRIAANRDEPDTVYIYQMPEQPVAKPAGRGGMNGYADSRAGGRKDNHDGDTKDILKTERRNAGHSPEAEAVRTNLPRPRTESFTFNPNTVSTEDLCRLGFSQKQAESIDNYRKKGGRFRRKTDFAKSFVVADSVYQRLEPFIDIPKVDLNLADSAAFDALPGIGGWFASKIIEHRRALGGFSYKEQLMDVYRFDEDKYRALEDLIEVNPATVTPYPLWTLPIDSLRKHPYIRNYETARGIALFRENSPKDSWTISNLIKAGIFTPENASKIEHISIARP